MFAVVDIAGFQEFARVGDTMQVPTLDAKEGATVVFEKVLLLADGSSVKVGMPVVAGAKVEAKVLSHGRSEKVSVVKFRRRKRYLRSKNHRQGFTEIEITKIA